MTITGVCESGGGGEELGVIIFPLFGVRSPPIDGDSGGCGGRVMVLGLIPGISRKGVSDINFQS